MSVYKLFQQFDWNAETAHVSYKLKRLDETILSVLFLTGTKVTGYVLLRQWPQIIFLDLHAKASAT